jgi:serine/threonine protein phosphatase PrpC
MVNLHSVVSLINAHMEEAVSFAFGAYEGVYLVRRHPEKSVTEDSVCLVLQEQESAVLAVADGLGGHKGGDMASKIAIETLIEQMEADKPGSSPMERITQSFDIANQRILELGIGAATTLVVGELQGKTCRFYHAGDSMGLILGSRGKCKWATLQHNQRGHGIESGMVAPQDPELLAVNHIVTNYLGTPAMRIEVSPAVELDPKDRIMLMSDGISDNLKLNLIPNGSRAVFLCDWIDARVRACMGTESGKPDDAALIVMCQR